MWMWMWMWTIDAEAEAEASREYEARRVRMDKLEEIMASLNVNKAACLNLFWRDGEKINEICVCILLMLVIIVKHVNVY